MRTFLTTSCQYITYGTNFGLYIYVILHALSFIAPRAQRGGRTYINRSTPLARVQCRCSQSCSFTRLAKHTHLTYLKRKILTSQGNIERHIHSKNHEITFDTTTQCHQENRSDCVYERKIEN